MIWCKNLGQNLETTMAAIVNPILYLPGEEEVEQWAREADGSFKQVSGNAKSRNPVWAFGCSQVIHAPFWAAEDLGKEELQSSMVLHWMAQGVELASAEEYAFWEVTREDGQRLMASAALNLSEEGHLLHEMERIMPEKFFLSLQLYSPPENGVALWREMGRYAVAFARQGKWCFATLLTSRVLDGKAARELKELMFAARSLSFIKTTGSVHLWASSAAEFVDILRRDVPEMRLVSETKPPPRLPEASGDLIPARVRELRALQKRKKLQVRWGLVLGSLYLMVFGVWAGMLWTRQQTLNKGWENLQNHSERVQVVKAAQARWEAHQSAVNPALYPTETFHQIVSLMPDEGVRLKEFTMDMEKLVVAGEASSINQALKFKADLQNHQALKRYEWNFPQPTILPDNRASFRAEGTSQKVTSL